METSDLGNGWFLAPTLEDSSKNAPPPARSNIQPNISFMNNILGKLGSVGSTIDNGYNTIKTALTPQQDQQQDIKPRIVQSVMPLVMGNPGTPPSAPIEVKHTIANSPNPKIEFPEGSKNSVIVSIPDKRVVILDPGNRIINSYPVYLGKPDAPTPEGKFNIIEDEKLTPNEWYYGGHFLSFKRQPEKNNPNYIDDFGFHGWTYDKEDDAEEKINPGWKTSTHGCIQLNNKDLAEFASKIHAGDQVTILNKRIVQ